MTFFWRNTGVSYNGGESHLSSFKSLFTFFAKALENEQNLWGYFYWKKGIPESFTYSPITLYKALILLSGNAGFFSTWHFFGEN